MASFSAGKLTVATLGVTLVWSGIRGASITGSIRDLINGQAPKAGTNIINPTSGTDSAGEGVAGTADGTGLAGDVEKYIGTPYVWGGSNPPEGSDCSGLVNAVVGRDNGMAIPGFPNGKYSGHGPVTGQWFTWSGCTTVTQATAQPGDLVCWLSHMGMYVGGGQMVSSLNPRLGTLKTSIAGASPPGEPMRIRRLKG